VFILTGIAGDDALAFACIYIPHLDIVVVVVVVEE